MTLDIAPGKYVVAISGGVDSMTLLHMLTQKQVKGKRKKVKEEIGLISHLPSPISQFIVAHFDHGIRPNSEEDRLFVENEAKRYGLVFEYRREELGENASEAEARGRRYAFLRTIKHKYQADAIITAHHKDDIIETAILNMIRGTNRNGLSSLKSGEIVRPLLATRKSEILDYAKRNNLIWRDDPSNDDLKYTRNKVRHILEGSDQNLVLKFENIIDETTTRNLVMDSLCGDIFAYGYNERDESFSRRFFISLPYSVSKEILAFWLRKLLVEFDKKDIERLTVAMKIAKPGVKMDINSQYVLLLSAKQISIDSR